MALKQMKTFSINNSPMYEITDEVARTAISSLQTDKASISAICDMQKKTPHVATIDEYYNMQRTGQVYQTKIYKFATNPTSTGEKLLDNKGLEFVPSTDTVEGKDDYLNGHHPLFEWCYCNYKRYDDGTAYPVATEFDDNYATSGAVDVGAMQMSFYWNWDASNPEYDLVTISDMPNEKYGLKPWVESVKADGTVLPYCIGSAYFSGVASDGYFRSQPNLKPSVFQSYITLNSNHAKKGKGYQGAGIERQTFQILFNIIKGATKNSQNLYQGCTNYSFQYAASVQSSESHTYFPVTNDQAKNILVGSYVSVGYSGLSNNALTNDRGYSTIHKYANDVKVLRIETLDSNNKAVYLDISTGFNTTPIKLSDTVNAPITLSSMYWWSGETNKVIGRHDGSPVSNTDARHPYRVQGREYACGFYFIPTNTAMEFQSDYGKKVYVAPKGVAHSTTESVIKSTYKCIGKIPGLINGADFWIGDIAVDVNTGGFYPSAAGTGSAQGYGDMHWACGASTSGFIEYLLAGFLWAESCAGSSNLDAGHSLFSSWWDFGGCD